MKLRIETTTGLPTPIGELITLSRAPAPATLQLLVNNVATLLPEGQPIALKLYNPADPNTVIATFADWTRNAAGAIYTAVLNPASVAALAWLTVPTLLARVTYGDPGVDTPLFHVSFGSGTAAAAAIAAPIVITQPAGPVTYTESLGLFAGKIAVGQAEGFWRAKAACQILGLQLNAQDAPTGANVEVDLTKNGVDQNKIAALVAGAKAQETIFGAPLAVAAGDAIRFKPTQVGSAKPGTNLAVKAIVQLV